MSKVSILGSGDVAQALATGFLEQGYEVKFGSRETGNPKILQFIEEKGSNATSGTFAEAVLFSDLIVIATAGAVVISVIELSGGPDAFSGKIVVDVTNPLVFENGMLTLTGGLGSSNGEIIQNALPSAFVVKAFNTVGYGMFYKPNLGGVLPTMFICGNDEASKQKVSEIVSAFGWEPDDVGGIFMSHYLESTAMIWILKAIGTGQRNMAFKLVKA